MKKQTKKQQGFSLLELLIVITIIGILAISVLEFLSSGKKVIELTKAEIVALQVTESLAEKFAEERLTEPRDGAIWVTAEGSQVDPPQPVPNARKFNYHAQTKTLENGMSYVVVQVDGEKGWTTHSSGHFMTPITDPGGTSK